MRCLSPFFIQWPWYPGFRISRYWSIKSTIHQYGCFDIRKPKNPDEKYGYWSINILLWFPDFYASISGLSISGFWLSGFGACPGIRTPEIKVPIKSTRVLSLDFIRVLPSFNWHMKKMQPFLSFFEFFRVFLSFNQNLHIYHAIFEGFLSFKAQKSLQNEFLQAFWLEKARVWNYSFESSRGWVLAVKLKKAQLKNTQNILSIFEFWDFESSYAIVPLL